jgi:hypothetical protein
MGTPTAPPAPQDTRLFLDLCSQANTKVDLADRRLSAWLSGLTVAYAQAWAKHTAVLRDAEGQVRLVDDFILNAALAFIPAGVGGLIGNSMKRLGNGDFLVDGVRDLFKAGARSGAVSGLLPKGYSIEQPALRVFPTDPLVWAKLVNVRVKSELAVVTQAIEAWQGAVNTNNPDFSPSFNPVEAVSQVLTLRPPAAAAQSLLTLNPMAVAPLQQQFEASFLISWIERFAYAAYKDMNILAWSNPLSGGCYGKIIAYGQSVGVADVKDRIDAAFTQGLRGEPQRPPVREFRI